MTQAQLAAKMGVATSTVAMWETGASAPRTQALPKLAIVLGCSVEQLLGIEMGDALRDPSSVGCADSFPGGKAQRDDGLPQPPQAASR